MASLPLVGALVFPFERLLPELKGEVMRVAPLVTSVSLGLTYTELFNHPNRPTVAFRTFVRAVCEEGNVALLPFIESVELVYPTDSIFDYGRGYRPALFTEEDLAAAAQNNRLEFLQRLLERAQAADPGPFSQAIRAAAQYRHRELLRVLLDRFPATHTAVQVAFIEGTLKSGDLAAIRTILPNKRLLQIFALLHCPLPLVQELVTPEFLSDPSDYSPAMNAAESPDPRVFPWCLDQGLRIDAHLGPQLGDRAVGKDRLENFLYIQERFGDAPGPVRSLQFQYAFKRCSDRILRHFFGPGKVPPVPPSSLPLDEVDLLLKSAPSPAHGLQLLVDTDLLAALNYNKLPILPDLAYLQLLVQLYWDPREHPLCLEKLFVGGWTPQTERCVFFLLEKGAQITPKFVALAASPIYRPSFLKRILTMGCPATSECYASLANSESTSDVDRRFQLLRAHGIPLPTNLFETEATHKLLRFASVEVLKELLAAQQPAIPPDCLDGPQAILWEPSLDVPRFKALLPLILPKLASPPDPAIFFYKALKAECRAGKPEDAEEVNAVLDLLDWLATFMGYPVFELEWSSVIASAARRWGITERVEGFRPLMDWFVQRGVPMEKPQQVFNKLVANKLEFQVGEDGAKAMADFLRSRGAVIHEKDEGELMNFFFTW